jgi:hypothetical protein
MMWRLRPSRIVLHEQNGFGPIHGVRLGDPARRDRCGHHARPVEAKARATGRNPLARWIVGAPSESGMTERERGDVVYSVVATIAVFAFFLAMVYSR